MRVLLGVSGGFDSASSLEKLKREGHTVEGAVLQMHDYTDTEGAEAVCQSLGIPLHIIDARERFDKYVRENFVSEYSNGRTPNPCIICNREVKLRVLLDYALEHGFTHIATGHYAKVGTVECPEGVRYTLFPPRDEKKDQTYMLSRLTQDILSHLVFPLADEEKRSLKEASTLSVSDKEDSQEICFIPDNNYKGYIEDRLGAFPEGDFIDTEGRVLGRHKGIIGYTVGQRKGLGISLGKRMFVSAINPLDNTVVLSDEDMKKKTVSLTGVTYMGIFPPENKLETEAFVKVRYTKAKESARVILEGDKGTVIFDEPVSSPTPGQTAAIFSIDGYLLASGFIE